MLNLQLMADSVISEIGQNVLLNVEEEPRQELEPAQTLLLRTEELTVKERNLKEENATLSVVLDQVCSLIDWNIIYSVQQVRIKLGPSARHQPRT